MKKKVFHSVRIGGSIRISKKSLNSQVQYIKCKVCQGCRTTQRQTSKHIESSIKCSHDQETHGYILHRRLYDGGNEKTHEYVSVPEMAKMLGLGKTESYWLIKKIFKTILVGNTMRVMIDSFEEWYAKSVQIPEGRWNPTRRGNEENYIFNGGAWTAPWAERSDCLRAGC